MNQTSPWIKFGVIIGIVTLIACLIFVATKQTAIEKSIVEMKQLSDGIVRSQAKYVSRDDLEDFGKKLNINLSAIQQDLEVLGANLQGINSVIVSSSGSHHTNLPSTSTTPNNASNTIDSYGYLKNQQTIVINEPFENDNVPFGEATFSAWKDKPWGLDIYKRQYNITTVIGQDENGRHYTYNKFTIEAKGKTYTVLIRDSKFEEVYPEAKFRFSPRLYLGVDGGVVVNPNPKAEMTPNIQVSFFSYGKTTIDPDWSLLGLGLGYETQIDRPVIILSPVSYNLGHHLPLVNNLHVGPSVSIDTAGGIGILGGIRVGL